MIIKLIILVWLIVFGVCKIIQTSENFSIVLNSIYLYKLHCIDESKKPMVDYDDMKPYSLSVLKILDWGYKHILPPEKYEIVEPFIQRSK